MELGLGNWASKALLSAIEIGVYTRKAGGAQPAGNSNSNRKE